MDLSSDSVVPASSAAERASSPSGISASSLLSSCSEALESGVMEKDASQRSQSPTSADSPAPQTKRHSVYYFDEENVLLMVEDTLYNLPSTPLVRHSSWFRNRLAQPADQLPSGWKTHTTEQGEILFVNHDLDTIQSSRPTALPSGLDSPVFCLHNVTVFEFDALLAVLWPENYAHICLTSQQWSSVLELATTWDFPSVCTLAAQHLDHALAEQPLERLRLANECGISEWREPALQQLVARKQSLEAEELAQLTDADIAYIASEREERLTCECERQRDELAAAREHERLLILEHARQLTSEREKLAASKRESSKLASSIMSHASFTWWNKQTQTQRRRYVAGLFGAMCCICGIFGWERVLFCLGFVCGVVLFFVGFVCVVGCVVWLENGARSS